MRANGDFAIARCFNRPAHRFRIARMKAAGDVCRGDKHKEFVVVPSAFAEIGVKIDNQAHLK
jgi:hypothetical protein